MGQNVDTAVGRVGLITDLHGNADALAAVLDDGHDQGVDRWLVLGDVVAMGPSPATVLSMLDDVNVVATLSGNTERYVVKGDRPEPTFEQVIDDPRQLPRLVEVVATFAWTKGLLTAVDRLADLSKYLPSLRFVLPDGTRVLAVHASLVSDEGPGISPSLGPGDVDNLFPDHAADLIIAGHTHHRTDIRIDSARFVNPGSVSNHPDPETPARYSILNIGERAHDLEHRDVIYDKQAAVRAIRECGIPGAEFLQRRYFGVTESDARP